MKQLPGPSEDPPPAPVDPDSSGLTSFENPWINALAPPLVAAAAMLFHTSPLGFLLEGFHVWIHELGHASVAWLSGHMALPLPLGWTNVEPEKSIVVYGFFLVLFCILGVSGWRERMAWPMALAAMLIGAQAYMTWFLPESRGHLWMIFAGVGGEFTLASAMMALFYIELPEAFRWGVCRYAALFVGAASFFETFSFWRQVKMGLEGIPYGSMIRGEDDGGGDMDILRNEYAWTQHHIIGAYWHLGNACLFALFIVYLFYNLRLNRVFYPVLARLLAVGDARPESLDAQRKRVATRGSLPPSR